MPRKSRAAPNVLELRTLLEPVMRAITSAVGKHCEVVLHDLTGEDFEHTIAAIENGHITGRSVGGPSTNLGLEVMQEHSSAGDEFGYRARTRDGRELHCSSIYFHDDNGQVIAALCINIDVTPYVAARGALSEVLNGAASQAAPDRGEIFASDINELLDQMIEEAVASTGKTVSMLRRDDRLAILRTLDERGAFSVKRAVERVSGRLGISRVTVYNYLDEIRSSAR
jgi:predicted transcriptional regulator YheO